MEFTVDAYEISPSQEAKNFYDTLTNAITENAESIHADLIEMDEEFSNSSIPIVMEAPSTTPSAYPSTTPSQDISLKPSVSLQSHYMNINIRQRICKKDDDVRNILVNVLNETFYDLLKCSYEVKSVELVNNCAKPNSRESKWIRLKNTAGSVWVLPSECDSEELLLNFYDTLALAIKENKRFIKKEIRKAHKKLKNAKAPKVIKEAPTSMPRVTPSISTGPSDSLNPSDVPSLTFNPTSEHSTEPTRSRSASKSSSGSKSNSKKKKAIIIP